MMSPKTDLMLVVTALGGASSQHPAVQHSWNRKSLALTSFLLFTEQTETFFLFSEQRRGRTQSESVAAPSLHEGQDANPPPVNIPVAGSCKALSNPCSPPHHNSPPSEPWKGLRISTYISGLILRSKFTVRLCLHKQAALSKVQIETLLCPSA